MKEIIRIPILLDYYSPLLTEKQNEMLKMYYEEDYSLSEISQLQNISRQAAFDTIKKGEAILNKYEELLNLSQKQAERENIAQQIKILLKKLIENKYDKNAADRIYELLEKITE